MNPALTSPSGPTSRSGAGPAFRDIVKSRRFLNVAHRGASAYAPENTLEAFELAITQGAEVIELDVHLTRDNEVVVIHDARVDRTTSGRGEVRAITLDELRSLDAGVWFGERWRGVHVPTLREVVERCANHALIDIELKAGITMASPGLGPASEPVYDPGPDARAAMAQMRGSLMAEDPTVTIPLAARVLEVVQQAALSRVMISGFGAAALAWARATQPDVATQWAVASTDISADAASAARCGFDVISPQAYAATAANIARAHEAGLAVYIYAGNSEDAMARLIALGVDAVKTGCPDRLRALLATLR